MSWRLETGPVKFGDDASGVFVRGDNAFAYAGYVLSAIELLPEDAIVARGLLQQVADELNNPRDPTPLRSFNRCNRFQCAVCGHFSECHAATCSDEDRCGDLTVCGGFVE